MRIFKGFESLTYKTNDDQVIWYAKNFKKPSAKKPTLVFNYGLVCTNQHWQYQINHFHDQGYSILLHDYRGHYTDQDFQISDITIANFVKDLDQLMTIESIDKCYMLGHSMGVNITLEYALQFPQKIQKLVLITGTVISVDSVLMGTSFFENISFQFSKLAKKVPTPVKLLWKAGLKNSLVGKIIHQQGFNQKRTGKEFVDQYIENIDKLKIELFFQLLEEMRKHQILQDLDDIEVPTLIIKGGKDNVIPPEIQNLIHDNIENSELFELKMGSHVPQVDFPQRTNMRLDRFFQDDLD